MAQVQCFICQLPIAETEAAVIKGKPYCSQCRIGVGGSAEQPTAPAGLPSSAEPVIKKEEAMPPGFGPPPSSDPKPESAKPETAAPSVKLPLPGRTLHYEHSGTIGFAGPVFMFSGAIAVAALTGSIYAYLVYWMPLVYVNGAACLAYGALLGMAIGQLGKAGSMRSSPFALLTGFFAGIFAVYFAWAVWFKAHASVAIWNPGAIMDAAGKIAVEGLWSIGPVEFKGGLLKAVWWAEALVIIGGSTILAWSAVAEGAYCESCHEWLTQTAAIRDFEPVLNPPALIPRLERGDFAALAGLGKVPVSADRFTKLELWACQKCRFLFCMSLTDVNITKDAEGEVSEEEEILLDKLIINAEAHDWILKRFA